MSEQINIFEQASRKNLLFSSTRGTLSVSDLWNLPLTTLDAIAVNLDEQVKKSGTQSFIKKTTAVNKQLQLQFDIVLHIITVKQQEEETRKAAANKAAKKQQLLELINNKENEQLQSTSLDELRKQLAELE